MSKKNYDPEKRTGAQLDPAKMINGMNIPANKQTIEATSIDNNSKHKEEVIMQTGKKKLAMLGVGDCGGTIVSCVKHGVDIHALSYNTSSRGEYAIENIDRKMYTVGTDGSGKDHEYSKEIMKEQGYDLIDTHLPEFKSERVVVSHAYAGGTAASAVNAIDHIFRTYDDRDVYSLGVIPRLTHDSTAHFLALKTINALQVLEGRNGANEPRISGYFMFDNNRHVKAESLRDMYDLVNTEIVNSMKLFSETVFGDVDRDCIDSEDFRTLISPGGRITSHITFDVPSSQMDVHDHMINVVMESAQPLPKNPKSVGLFIKGPEEMINKIKLDINKVMSAFCDAQYEPAYTPVHIEYDEEFAIGLITAGNDMPWERIDAIDARYKDFKKEQAPREMKQFDIGESFIGGRKRRGSRKVTEGDDLDI